jgi:hypothetical protein
LFGRSVVEEALILEEEVRAASHFRFQFDLVLTLRPAPSSVTIENFDCSAQSPIRFEFTLPGDPELRIKAMA